MCYTSNLQLPCIVHIISHAKNINGLDTQNYNVLYRIMQIIHGGKLSQFSQISLQSRKFSSEFFLCYYKVFRIAIYNRESFPTNNNKIMQL